MCKTTTELIRCKNDNFKKICNNSSKLLNINVKCQYQWFDDDVDDDDDDDGLRWDDDENDENDDD